MKRFSAICILIGVQAIVGASCASANILFESGTLGPTGIPYSGLGGGTAPGSSGVLPEVFSGVRFQLSDPVLTSRIGGHFVADPRLGSTSFFGAIVRLESGTDFPDSGNLSTPDVVDATLLTFPHPSAEVFGDLEVRLDPGWHALVFGSGLFGATGGGAAVLNNPDIGSPMYFGHQPSSSWFEISPPHGPFENFRLVLEGIVVPEPSSFATTLLLVAFLLKFFRRKS